MTIIFKLNIANHSVYKFGFGTNLARGEILKFEKKTRKMAKNLVHENSKFDKKLGKEMAKMGKI